MIEVRDRISGRINRARVDIELRRAAKPALVVLAGLILGGVLALYIVGQVSSSLLTANYVQKIELDDATGVLPGNNEVRFKGVRAGSIDDMQIENGHPVIKIKYEKKYGRLYRDAKLQLRPSTALQDMYVDILDRGTPSKGGLPENTPLPRSQTEVPVNVTEVLDILRPNQRARLRTLLDDLGNGMKDRGRSLRQIFVLAVPFIQRAGALADALADREPLVRRLVHNTSTLTRELGRRDDELRTLVDEGGRTLSTLQAGRGDLDATLRELAPTVGTITSSFATVRGVLPQVDGAVRALGPVAEELPGSLRDLRRLNKDAAPAVRSLQEPVVRLVPLAKQLRPLSRSLAASLRVLAPQIDTIDKVTKTTAGCKSGIQGFFQWNASMSKFGDSRGPVPRGNVVIGAQSSSIFKDPEEYAPQSCAPGAPIGGRVPTAKDFH